MRGLQMMGPSASYDSPAFLMGEPKRSDDRRPVRREGRGAGLCGFGGGGTRPAGEGPLARRRLRRWLPGAGEETPLARRRLRRWLPGAGEMPLARRRLRRWLPGVTALWRLGGDEPSAPGGGRAARCMRSQSRSAGSTRCQSLPGVAPPLRRLLLRRAAPTSSSRPAARSGSKQTRVVGHLLCARWKSEVAAAGGRGAPPPEAAEAIEAVEAAGWERADEAVEAAG